MPDTEDVAKVLYEVLFDEKYDNELPARGWLDYKPDVILDRLITLSELCRIGIEDARMFKRMMK